MYCCLFLEMFTAFWFYVLLFSSVWHYLLYEFYFIQPCFKILNIRTYSQGKTADTCTVPYYRVLNDFILQGPYNGVTYISGKKKKEEECSQDIQVLPLFKCFCSWFPREAGKTRGWMREPGPQAEGHDQTSALGPSWLSQSGRQPAIAMPESWHGSLGHAARGKQVGGGQSRMRFLRVHRTEGLALALPFPVTRHS